jgi:hypothetical protein
LLASLLQQLAVTEQVTYSLLYGQNRFVMMYLRKPMRDPVLHSGLPERMKLQHRQTPPVTTPHLNQEYKEESFCLAYDKVRIVLAGATMSYTAVTHRGQLGQSIIKPLCRNEHLRINL